MTMLEALLDHSWAVSSFEIADHVNETHQQRKELVFLNRRIASLGVLSNEAP